MRESGGPSRHRARVPPRRKGSEPLVYSVTLLMSLQEWNAFIDALTPLVTEMDDQIPPLPAKDLIHRIYRDVGPFFPTFFQLQTMDRAEFVFC